MECDDDGEETKTASTKMTVRKATRRRMNRSTAGHEDGANGTTRSLNRSTSGNEDGEEGNAMMATAIVGNGGEV